MNMQFMIKKYKEPFVINRFLSMDKNRIELCSYFNKFIFRINKDICLALMLLKTKGRIEFNEYIKKIPKPKLDEVWVKVKKYYNWSDRDLEEQKPYLIKEEWEKFFGLETI